MRHDEKMLEIEIERFVMEKKRDYHANLRFYIGSVFLVIVLSSASFYINSQQENRSIINAERQWVIPILISTADKNHDERIRILDVLLSSGLSSQMIPFLTVERDKTYSEKKALEEKDEALIKANKLAEEKANKLAKAIEEVASALKDTEKKKVEVAREKSRLAEEAAKKAADQAKIIKREREAFIRQQIDDRILRMGGMPY